MRPIPPVIALRFRLEKATTLRDALASRLATTTTAIKRLENETELLDLVCELFRRLIDLEVKVGVAAVETLQSEGLRAVFADQDLRVRADVEVQRGKVCVDLVTMQRRSDGAEVEGVPEDSFGGSVLTVESVLLRIITIMRRGLRPFMGLDEVLPAFDPRYIVNMGQFLATLCHRLNLDLLLVSHNPTVAEAADRAYEIMDRGGAAHFRVVR